MTKGNRKYRILGKVIDRQTQCGMAALRVEAWDKDPLFDDLLGTAITDETGAFEIKFDESYFQEIWFDADPDIFFRVFSGETLIKATEDAILWNVKKTVIEITLEVDGFHSNHFTETSPEAFPSLPRVDSSYYKVGGSLEYQNPTYIVRQADQELYQSLRNGEFCYVLNSRQMGKSSLRVQTMKRLQQQGVKCASIDMMRIGSDVAPAEWYGGVVSELIRGFGLTRTINFSAWWRERDLLSPIQRLSEFIEDVLLVEFQQNIVIFIDEIDSILKFAFRNDFFSLIRTCYNNRADQPAYQRLTFAFLGVATPSDLIADRNRTPFNIGRAIILDGFQLQEAKPLAEGLAERASRPHVVLREVLDWTNGQPFLTQKLCSLVAASRLSIPVGKEARVVESIVRSNILNDWTTQDEPEHLRTIRDRLLGDGERSLNLLRLYRQVLRKNTLPADGSSTQMLLRLSGVVVQRSGQISVYNRIYRSLFNLSWVEREIKYLEGQTRDEQRQRLRRRLLKLCALFIVSIIGVFALRGQLFPKAPIVNAVNYFSEGERVLIRSANSDRANDLDLQEKIAEEIAQQQYSQAIADLETLLDKNPNNPEALVALNNVRISAQISAQINFQSNIQSNFMNHAGINSNSLMQVSYRVNRGSAPSQPYYYKIAVSLPMRDNTIGNAEEILRGVAQAQDEVNQQGGIEGVPLKVLMVKEDARKQVVRQIATILAQRPDVLGVVGHYSSDMSKIAGEVYQKNQLVMISPTSTAMDIANLGDYIFRTVPNDQDAATLLADCMVQTLQKTKAAIFYETSSVYSQSLTRELTTALQQRQGQVVAKFDLASPDFDAMASLAEAKERQSEVLILLNSTTKLDKAKEVVKRNNSALPLLGGDSLYSPEILSLGEPAISMLVAVPWVFQPQDQFAQRGRKLWRADVSWRTVTAYDATEALIAGLKGRSRQGVQRILADPNFSVPGAIKPVRFTSSGDRAETMQLAVVEPDPGSKLGYRFVPKGKE